MSKKINLELETAEEKWVADRVINAKEHLRRAEAEYKEALVEACAKVHYKKIAQASRQSDGAIRMQLKRAAEGLTCRPR